MNKIKRIMVLVVLLSSVITGCRAEEETVTVVLPTNTPIPIPKMMPGEPPPQAERTLEDVDSSIKAGEKRAVTGDNFLNSLYERPFTSQEMVYQPHLNILTASIVSDEYFYYFTIVLDEVDPTTGTLTGTYGIEFDRTLTGRGDLLVWASIFTEEWSMDGLEVYSDPYAQVGGVKPIVAEEGYENDGYVNTVELKDDQVAWVRLAPDQEAALQIAISRALLGDPEEFLWGAWADGGISNPALFDYNDHFGPSEAGSPINTDPDYPLKAVASLDNTCRLPYGFAQVGSIPGMCLSIPELNQRLVCRCVRWSPPTAQPVVCLEWECE